MTRRILNSNIWSNENFASMPPMARLLQIGIINMADDQGRMKAHPAYLRSHIFPYDDVDVEDITMWLSTIESHGTAALYEVDGKAYLQLLNWWEYQTPSFAAPSAYPRMDGWQDRIRYTGKSRKIYTCAWVTSTGELMTDSCDMDGSPLAAPHDPPCAAPYGQPHDPPHAPLNKDQDQYKDQQQPTEEDDENAREGTHAATVFDGPAGNVFTAWTDNIPGTLTPILKDNILDLFDECGESAILHGIRAAVEANARNWKYVEACARNHAAGKEPPGKPVHHRNGKGQKPDATPNERRKYLVEIT